MRARDLRPGMQVIVGVGEPNTVTFICCYAEVVQEAEVAGMWWLNVDHGGGQFLAQMYSPDDIIGLPALNLTRRTSPAVH